MLAVRIAPCLALASLAGLAACGSSSPFGSTIADPTPQEAFDALAQALNGASPSIVYAPGGPVSDCVDGKDAAGRTIRTCNACEVLLSVGQKGLMGQQLQVERSRFSLAFRRAVSAAQPDIAPTNDAQGLWVNATTGAIPRITTFASMQLTSDDIRPLGLSIQHAVGGGDTVCLPPSPGTVLGFCVEPGSQAVLNRLSSAAAGRIVHAIVGDCSSST